MFCWPDFSFEPPLPPTPSTQNFMVENKRPLLQPNPSESFPPPNFSVWFHSTKFTPAVVSELFTLPYRITGYVPSMYFSQSHEMHPSVFNFPFPLSPPSFQPLFIPWTVVVSFNSGVGGGGGNLFSVPF